jgi:membrane-associated phospholipid phosphatase
VVVGGLLFLFWRVPLPLDLRLAGALPLACIVLGIGWSRIALGAHHLTDVLGGYSFGAAWLCGGLWLYLTYGP